MSALTFTLRAEPPERLDLSPLVPHRLAKMSVSDIERIVVGQSKRAARVGDVFAVSGSNAAAIVFSGGSARFDGIGTELVDGSITVDGDCGARIGSAMRGGRLAVTGNVGPHAGSGLRGGRIDIYGDAGEQLGGPLAGELAGMNGGVLVARGKAGDLCGTRMRRGVIAVLGGAGDYPGASMIAGTLVVLGGTGALPGYGMRRGSILLDRAPKNPSPTFLPCGAPDSVFSALIDRYLVEDGILRRPLLGRAPHRLGGDNAVAGTGEILYPARR